MWNILGNYNLRHASFVMIGDEAQLQPIVLSTLDENSLGKPLRLSYFHRMKLLGHPSAIYNTQYRMVEPIGRMISSRCFEDTKRGEKFDIDTAKAFGLARRNLIDDTISRADIIITTLSNTGEASLVKHLNPNLIILDEAARALEIDMWNVLGITTSGMLRSL